MQRVKSLLILVLMMIIFFTSCTHTTPFKDDYYFRALGDKGDVVVTLNVDNSRELYEDVATQQDTSALDPIVERSDRISLSIDTSTSAEEPSYYGGIEGNFGRFSTSTALLFNSEWEKVKTSTLTYFDNPNTGLQVAIPKSGIVLFSNDDIEKVFTKTFKEREIFVPYDIAKELGEGLFGLYIEDPDDISLFTDAIPKTMLMSIDSVWCVLTGQKDDYRLFGEIRTKNTQSSRVLGTLLKMSYFVQIKKLKYTVEGWEDAIRTDQNIIQIENMYLENDKVTELFSGLLKNF